MTRRKRSTRHAIRPSLRFSPEAWAKFLFLRDRGETEVGGFGLSSLRDPLLVEDILLVPQVCSVVSVSFDDAAVADFFDRQVDAGRNPAEFARIWLHTHPGASALPSGTDEETFARVFGGCDWAVMGILAREGASFARLRFNAGPGGSLPLGVTVDFGTAFAGADPEGWDAEYRAIRLRDISGRTWD